MIYFQSFILAPSNRLSASLRKKPTACSAGVRFKFLNMNKLCKPLTL